MQIQQQIQLQSAKQTALQKLYDQFSWFLFKLEKLERKMEQTPISSVMKIQEHNFLSVESKEHLIKQIQGPCITLPFKSNQLGKEMT